MAKSTKFFNYGNVHTVVIEDSKYWESSVFFAEKNWFCNEASFAPQLTISAIKSNVRITT